MHGTKADTEQIRQKENKIQKVLSLHLVRAAPRSNVFKAGLPFTNSISVNPTSGPRSAARQRISNLRFYALDVVPLLVTVTPLVLELGENLARATIHVEPVQKRWISTTVILGCHGRSLLK